MNSMDIDIDSEYRGTPVICQTCERLFYITYSNLFSAWIRSDEVYKISDAVKVAMILRRDDLTPMTEECRLCVVKSRLAGSHD